MKRIPMLLAASFVLTLLATASLAQSGSSSVRGLVTDPQGNPVAGASVTLADARRNFSRSQTTNSDGNYLFKPVPSGLYRLEVESRGFKKSVVASVEAQVDTAADVDVQLEVGSVSETVNIASSGEAPINTTDATLGNTFNSKRISELPLNARNVVGLLSLQAGVTQSGYVNGGRADQANVTLDGVDVNEQQRGLDVVTGNAFSSVLRVTPDSVQEFRVTTTNANPDQGRSSGAQVSLVTRSGSNDWHGLLYEYHRNTVTTANDFFNNRAGVPRPALLRNIFGGYASGPIKKDRAYFFFTYEGFREATSTSVVRLVPLAASIGQGVIWYESTIGGVPNPAGFACPIASKPTRRCLSLTPAQITAGYAAANGGLTPGTNAAAIALLQDVARRYPSNDTTQGDLTNTGGYRFNASTPTKNDTYISKFDFVLTDRQTMFVRANYQNDIIGQAPQFPDTPPPNIWNHPKGLAIGHTWTVSNRIVNNFVYGLTRLSFSQLGDSAETQVSFRNIYGFTPTRTLSRLTPVHNFADDITWTRGNHVFQFGPNIRFITNTRNSFGSAYDFVQTNPSGYNASGAVVTRAGADGTGAQIFSNVDPNFEASLRNALTAYIGRFSSYTANFLYGADGKILPGGTSSDRSFATQEYDAYFQDIWRMKQNLTMTYGVRYSTSTPVYEKNGFEVVPTTPLGEFFELRKQGAFNGTPYNAPITLDKGGKFYNKPGFYPQDWNNFGPSVALAWSPNFNGFLGKLLGRDGKSVFRGGVRVTYDHIGGQLAVNFDASNQLGFASALSIPVNTYNVTNSLAPPFTPGAIDVRTFQGIVGNFGGQLTFPLTKPSDQAQRIETSLDSAITTPYNYNAAFSYERELGKGLKVQVAYVGRFARNLLAQRDVATFNNLRDPKSNTTFYQAMAQLIALRYAGTPVTSVASIPWFENILPGLAGTFSVLGVNRQLTATQRAYQRIAYSSVGGIAGGFADYTFRQLQWDDTPVAFTNNIFVHPQYAALTTWATIARSNYHSGQISITQRLKNDITFDLNYTVGHSLDNASGLQNAGNFSTAALIFNPLDPDSQYANSDFDVRHIVNANWLIGLPLGRGKLLFRNANKWVNGIFGGWQMTGIFRWNSGFPVATPFGSQRWPTNWQISSTLVPVRTVESNPTNAPAGGPNLFSDPLAAFLSYRDSIPGE
ncbi:MAG TPA: carboxypeptidase-like regulatory domain-containing protein, partial [Pyrinomonadaceae bacterium]|nr:carboxypeptidase-like regulatory domain-containing protein [Pyrinomonadaceae bacterium]